MLRSAKVAGSLPMPASAMAAQVEKQRGWLSSPWQRITKAVARLWPLFKTPRSSSFSLRKVSVSSISKVGRAASMTRKATAGVRLAAARGRQVSWYKRESKVVLPENLDKKGLLIDGTFEYTDAFGDYCCRSFCIVWIRSPVNAMAECLPKPTSLRFKDITVPTCPDGIPSSCF